MQNGTVKYNDGTTVGSAGEGSISNHGNVKRSNLPGDGDCRVGSAKKGGKRKGGMKKY